MERFLDVFVWSTFLSVLWGVAIALVRAGWRIAKEE